MLEVLRAGSSGPLVEKLENFLRGRGLYDGPADAHFDAKTHIAVAMFQRNEGLAADGVVGNMTWGALMRGGLEILSSDDADWPPEPLGMQPLTAAQRAAIFGELVTEPAPTSGNPESVRILSRGPEYNVIEVALPKLRGVQGFPSSGRIFFHEKVARQLQLFVEALDDAGELHRVLTWGGSLAVRYIRNSRTTLSAHAWGTALDWNVPWNLLGSMPALAGRKGSVREIVGIANEHGFYWGGHFTRRDGMHFEVARVL